MSKWKYYANYGDAKHTSIIGRPKNVVISGKQKGATVFRNGSAFRSETEEVDKCVRGRVY